MPTEYDVARRLFRGQTSMQSTSASVGGVSAWTDTQARVLYGTAVTDSEDGWVDVLLDTSGLVDGDDGRTIRCVARSPIIEGQRVSVIISSDGEPEAIPIGDNIESTKVVSVVTQWAGSDSGDVAPTDGWSSAWPVGSDYVWQRALTTYGDGTTTASSPVCVSRPPEGYEDDHTVYATSGTGSSTAAKVATSEEGLSELKVGTTVAVTFTNGNTASSPTLNVDGTGAKAIRTNGTSSAYWVAGASVIFTYDGTYWQNCSTPVYASTVTVGNPGSKNVYIDGTHMAFRNGTTDFAYFDEGEIDLGIRSSSSVVTFCAGKGMVRYVNPASVSIGGGFEVYCPEGVEIDGGNGGVYIPSIGFNAMRTTGGKVVLLSTPGGAGTIAAGKEGVDDDPDGITFEWLGSLLKSALVKCGSIVMQPNASTAFLKLVDISAGSPSWSNATDSACFYNADQDASAAVVTWRWQPSHRGFLLGFHDPTTMERVVVSGAIRIGWQLTFASRG